MKKFFAFLLCGALLTGATACGARNAVVTEPPPIGSVTEQPDAGLTTQQWFALDNTVHAWYSDDNPENSVGDEFDTMTIRVGKTADGGEIFSLLRVPMKGIWLADEVQTAQLVMKVSAGDAPAALRIGAVTQIWGCSDTTRGEARAFVGESSLKTADVHIEADGWVSLDVTEYVKNWLSGEIPNYGLALFADGAECVFECADWEDDDGNPLPFPYLVVSGAAGGRALTYGKFGYTETPLPGAGVDEGGNCMSYALRDTNMILISDLNPDADVMNRLYAEQGEDALADYFAELVTDYVAAHKDGLQVSNFRRLDDYTSAIDAAAEYRIAMRVGCNVYDGDDVDLEANGAFDYHFRAQLSDGTWAQKFPLDTSEIVPCTSAGVSPGKYGWDSALQWLPKFQNYYTSKVVYFAVTKDTDEFTSHRGE